MGCTSSIQTKKDNSITGENSKNEMAVDEDTKSPTDNLHSGLPEDKTSSLETKAFVSENAELNQLKTNTSPTQEISVNVPVFAGVTDVHHVEPTGDTEANNEIEDVVDMNLKPATYKKDHPTQETLNFVYENSLNEAETNNGNGFSLSSSGNGNFTSLSTNRYVDRRPSGIPPPARALKPGDFLYQKTMNTPDIPALIEVP